MAIVLESAACRVVAGQFAAALEGGTDQAGPPPQLEIVTEDGVVIWRLSGLRPSAPPARDGKGEVRFRLSKDQLLEQRGLFPEAQAPAKENYSTDRRMRGEERWGGHARAISEPIASHRLSRAFVALPEPAAFVADTGQPPTLQFGWSPAPGAAEGGGLHLSFEVAAVWDAAPDRRWPDPVVELYLDHQTYADIMAALQAIR